MSSPPARLISTDLEARESCCSRRRGRGRTRGGRRRTRSRACEPAARRRWALRHQHTVESEGNAARNRATVGETTSSRTMVSSEKTMTIKRMLKEVLQYQGNKEFARSLGEIYMPSWGKREWPTVWDTKECKLYFYFLLQPNLFLGINLCCILKSCCIKKYHDRISLSNESICLTMRICMIN